MWRRVMCRPRHVGPHPAFAYFIDPYSACCNASLLRFLPTFSAAGTGDMRKKVCIFIGNRHLTYW
jgi:hypothetical protein